MDRKSLRIVSLCVSACIAIGCIFYLFRHEIQDNIISLIAYELDREREKDVGRYTVEEFGSGKFTINHDASGNHLNMHENDSTAVVILENISHYKEKNDKLYAVAPCGETVIDKSNIAYVHRNDYDPTIDKDAKITRGGSYIIFSKHYISDSLIYLDSYDDFNETDRKIFDKIKD